MPVKHEIKSQLAKLLATEDLIVEHKKVKTASFDVHRRLLTLPMWEKASNTVYDMLVGHEVGHALFTPDEDLPKDIPHQFVNVVEDVRIEKLMKRKYMGLAKTFYNGYKELSDDDFFELEGEDISLMNLADRTNLYYKIGNYIDIHIEDGEEKELVNMIGETETFADVLIAAEELYKYCKKSQKGKETPNIPQQKSSGVSGEQSEQQQNEMVPPVDNSSEGEDKENENNSGEDESFSDLNDEPKVQTSESLESNLENLIDNSGFYENTYVEIPQVNLDTIIAKNSDVHEVIDDYSNHHSFDYFQTDADFVDFKRSAQKEVNYLVKEFECRKAADSYARASTSRTGVLDCTKLHTYKYNEDLFKKVTTLADGKNHGLVFVLDWSGSMGHVIKDTIKQLYNLIWFCKKVSIPFDVYAFTNEWRRNSYNFKTEKYDVVDMIPHYEKKENLLSVDASFTMMNILTSDVNGKKLEHQMRNIWRIANYFSSYATYSIPDRLSLSGTPLNEAFVSLHQILPKFQKQHKLQKVQCVILTDGEANHLPYHVEIQRHWESEPYIGSRHLKFGTQLRDRKLGTTYSADGNWNDFVTMMLNNLRDNFPTVNFIGIRVLESRDANHFIKMHYEQYTDEYIKVLSDWKKLRSFTIKNSGYHAYFGLSATALSQNADFEVDDGATKAKIKSAFIKSLKTKKLNKKVLGEFISLVA